MPVSRTGSLRGIGAIARIVLLLVCADVPGAASLAAAPGAAVALQSLPPVELRDQVFRRAGLARQLARMNADHSDRDILYIHAASRTAQELVARYPWMTRASAIALMREVRRAERKREGSSSEKQRKPVAPS